MFILSIHEQFSLNEFLEEFFSVQRLKLRKNILIQTKKLPNVFFPK